MNSDALSARRERFRQLHEAGCFVIPNAWDAGSARWLQSLGFQAIATTSGGLAFGNALPDAAWAVPVETVLRNVAEIAGAAEVPVSVDFESGYADDPDGVAENVRRCIEAGACGLSIEDRAPSGDPPLYDLGRAVARVSAARAAIDESGSGVVLTARAECFGVGHEHPLQAAIERLQAYADAGADVLFAPGPADPAVITAIVEAVAPKPVNVIVSAAIDMNVADLADLGVRRISVGSALFRTAWNAFDRAARGLAAGKFDGLDAATAFETLNRFFREGR